MQDAIKFVKAATTRGGSPIAQHFRISRGTIRAFDGALTACSPIAIDIEACPNADQFLKAVTSCGDKTFALHMKGEKLVLTCGKLRANIDCLPLDQWPELHPTGQMFKVSPDFYKMIVKLEKFIGENANRAWCCGLMFDTQSVYATNNLVVVEGWHGLGFPTRFNVPHDAISVLLRVGEAPEAIQFDSGSVTFRYKDGRWLKSAVIAADWPDIASVIERAADDRQEPISEELFDAFDQLEPFCHKGDPCHFLGDRISTKKEAELEGVSVAVPCPVEGVFNCRQLVSLRNVANTAAFAAWPKPVPFYGDNLRGVLVGYAR